MMWGCIASDGPKECFVFDKGSINGEVYRTKIIPLINRIVQQHQEESLFRQRPIVMQDNASIHRARETLALISQLGFDVMSWPANSPDLNLIENVWSLLKHRIGLHFPTTREEVVNAIQIEWKSLTSSDIARVCQTMRRRCEVVIDARGGHTKW